RVGWRETGQGLDDPKTIVFINKHTQGFSKHGFETRVKVTDRFESAPPPDKNLLGVLRCRARPDQGQGLDDIVDAGGDNLPKKMPHGRRFELVDAKSIPCLQETDGILVAVGRQERDISGSAQSLSPRTEGAIP